MSNAVSSEVLVAYALDEIDASERAEVGAYIARTPTAAAFVETVDRLVRTMRSDTSTEAPEYIVRRVLMLMESPPALTETRADVAGQVREFLCRLVRDTLTEPALEGFRGTTDSRHLSFECEAAEIDLQVSGGGESDARRMVRGQVAPTGDAPVSLVSWRSALPGASEKSVPVDESGMFVLECSAGVYELIARVGESIVRVPAIDVA